MRDQIKETRPQVITRRIGGIRDKPTEIAIAGRVDVARCARHQAIGCFQQWAKLLGGGVETQNDGRPLCPKIDYGSVIREWSKAAVGFTILESAS